MSDVMYILFSETPYTSDAGYRATTLCHDDEGFYLYEDGGAFTDMTRPDEAGGCTGGTETKRITRKHAWDIMLKYGRRGEIICPEDAKSAYDTYIDEPYWTQKAIDAIHEYFPEKVETMDKYVSGRIGADGVWPYVASLE